MRSLGACYRSTWLLKRKLIEVMRPREEPRQLDGRMEIDGAYLGGERLGGKRGRASENKAPFIAAVQTRACWQMYLGLASHRRSRLRCHRPRRSHCQIF